MIRLYEKLFSLLDVKYTRQALRRIINESSYQWSIFGVSIVLRKYGVETTCVQYDDKKDIAQAQFPCVVIFNRKFAIIDSIKDGTVRLYLSDGREVRASLHDFCELWSGVSLRVNAVENSVEPDFGRHQKAARISRFKYACLAVASLCFIGIAVSLNPESGRLYWWGVLILNLLGLGVSYLLLQKQLHIGNPFTDKLCGLLTGEHGCDSVINSEQSMLFGLVKFAEIGGSFFLVNLAAILFFPQAMAWASLISVIVLPFSFWSIWFQKFKARQWCALCLATLVLMWAQAIVYAAGGVVGGFFHHVPAIATGAELLAGYVIVCLALNAAMSFLQEYLLHRVYHSEYYRLKLDPKVVRTFEESAERFATDEAESSSLVFGNPKAPTRITVLSNPYCGPCSQMHEVLRKVPGEDVNVQYILSNFSDEKSIINKYLIAAYQQLGADKAWQIMSDWYGSDKTQGADFFKDMGLDPGTDAVGLEFLKHTTWRRDDRLKGTPTVIINGLEVTYPYSVDDYMYM